MFIHERINSEEEDAEAIVTAHIKSLHRYNEAKDAAQVSAYTHLCLNMFTYLSIGLDFDRAGMYADCLWHDL